MQKKDKFLLGILLLLFGFIVFSESKRKSINWSPSFAVQHKIPFGSYIAYHEAKKIFADHFFPVKISPYLFLKNQDTINGTYVLYNTQINLGKASLETLLNWVKKGNTLFLASETIDSDLLDSLGLKTQILLAGDTPDKAMQLQLTNPNLQSENPAVFDKKTLAISLTPIDSFSQYKTTVLGQYRLSDHKNKTNFLAIKYGKGKILIHSFPYVMTNYFILEPSNLPYFEGILSYLNTNHNIYWDVHYQNAANSESLLQYILQNQAFTWAYRLLFAGIFFYILIEGKRRQKAIPVKLPPKNETLSFTQTIADMYLEKGKHSDISTLYLKHIYEVLRNRFHIETFQDKVSLKNQLKQKISLNKKDKDRFIKLLELLEQNKNLSDNLLMELDQIMSKLNHTHQ